MILISFPAGIAVTLFGWLLFRFFANAKRGSLNWKHETKQLLFLINILVILRVTFYPFATVNGQIQPLVFDAEAAWPFRVNLIPFVNLLDYESRFDLLLNIIGNFALFIPTGILTPLIYKQRNTLRKVVTTGFFLSLAIEIIQLPFAVRASDVDDLILNTAGCLAGYGIYRLFRHRKK